MDSFLIFLLKKYTLKLGYRDHGYNVINLNFLAPNDRFTAYIFTSKTNIFMWSQRVSYNRPS